jgi:hypothetical protein
MSYRYFIMQVQRYTGTLLTIAALLPMSLGPCVSAFAQEAAPAPDAVIDQLLALKPEELVASIAAMKQQSETQAAEAATLKTQAEQLEQQAVQIQAQVDQLIGSFKMIGESLFPPAAAPEMAAAAPAPEMAPEMAPAAMVEGPPPVNFAEHVAPILKEHCAKCHNEDNRKSGFASTSFALAMEGGSSGQVITPGDPDGSRLLRLLTKAEEPAMPPNGPIPAEQIEIIRTWIKMGALPDANAKPMAQAAAAPAADAGNAFVAATFADTPPMPEIALAAAQPAGLRPVVARAMDTSPTAPLLAVGGHQQVLLYDTQQFALIGALPFPEGDVFSLTFSVNGELLLVGGGKEGDSGAGVLYNVRKGERVAAFTDFYDTVLAVDISPDHRMVALGGPNRVVRVYRTDTSELAYKIDKHTEWILAVKFTPDGEVLTTADRSGAMYVWQAANGRYVEELKGHAGAIHALSYTADSAYLASAGEDGTVQIWDTWAYTRVRSIAAHSAAVLNLDLGKDNTILTTGQDATTRLFAFDGTAVRTFAGLNDWGYQTCFDNAGTAVLAGSWRGDILVWNKENAEQLRTISTQPSAT